MSNLPPRNSLTLAPRADYIDPQTYKEAMAGGPEPAPMPLLRLSYNPQRDLVAIEGVVYGGDFFREFGHRMALEQPFKIVAREEDGAIAVVMMEPHDPDWRGERAAAGAGEWKPVSEPPAAGTSCLVTDGDNVALTLAQASMFNPEAIAFGDVGFTSTHWAPIKITLPGKEPKAQ